MTPLVRHRDHAKRPIDAISADAPARQRGRTRPSANERGERLIWLEDAMADRLGALRGPGETYSDVILRIAAEKATKPKRAKR